MMLTKVTLDKGNFSAQQSSLDREFRVAIEDLLDGNRFKPFGLPPQTPTAFHLVIGFEDTKLHLLVQDEQNALLAKHILSLTPFRRIIRDYKRVCDSYYDAVKHTGLADIEALDMGRRSLHNEAAELLRDRLDNKIEIDFDTSRRIFTLIYLLYLEITGNNQK